MSDANRDQGAAGARLEAELGPPTREGRALAARHVEEAFAVLLETCATARAVHATRLRAAQTVIERAWGAWAGGQGGGGGRGGGGAAPRPTRGSPS
jgi:hypothetical protein